MQTSGGICCDKVVLQQARPDLEHGPRLICRWIETPLFIAVFTEAHAEEAVDVPVSTSTLDRALAVV